MNQLKELYMEVFDSDLETVKPCGRDSCKRLIVALSDRWPGVDFGSVESGFMNVKNVVSFGRKIFEE